MPSWQVVGPRSREPESKLSQVHLFFWFDLLGFVSHQFGALYMELGGVETIFVS